MSPHGTNGVTRNGFTATESGETAPLLQLDPEPELQDDSPDPVTPDSGSNSEPPTSPLYPRALIFVFLLAFLADIGGSLTDTPSVRLLEMAVCRDYYRIHDPSVIGEPPLSYVDEKLCKLDPIQVELAYLKAVKGLISTIPGILFSVPYGRLSDRIGRRPVMFLGLLGAILAFVWPVFVCYFHETLPTRLVLLSGVFNIIGGGARVTSAVLFSIIVDVAPESTRSTIFYVVGAGILATDIVMAPVGSLLLVKDLWLPYKFSIPILLSSLPIALAMPETLHKLEPAEDDSGFHLLVWPSPYLPVSSNSDLFAQSTLQRIPAHIGDSFRGLTSSWTKREIRVCFLLVFLFHFTLQSGTIFIQYLSKVLDWPISSAGFVISLNGLVYLAVLLSLGGITRRSSHLDLSVLRASSIALVLGAFIMALGRTPAVFIAGSAVHATGTGAFQALQALLGSYVDASSTGQVFSSATVVELLGGLLGNLAFAEFFRIGLMLGSSWGMGFPYFVAAVCRRCSYSQWRHN